MSSSARIEELQRKYDENPRRYFAPLANEFRKAGDAEQAIAICREHIPQQPGHMSGHIVFGQALFEAGQLDESRSIFETALTLDPENLIALRHLGDIARVQGELQEARSWYGRVLEADPRNAEIAATLAGLGDSGESAPEPAGEEGTEAVGGGLASGPSEGAGGFGEDVVDGEFPVAAPADLAGEGFSWRDDPDAQAGEGSSGVDAAAPPAGGEEPSPLIDWESELPASPLETPAPWTSVSRESTTGLEDSDGVEPTAGADSSAEPGSGSDVGDELFMPTSLVGEPEEDFGTATAPAGFEPTYSEQASDESADWPAELSGGEDVPPAEPAPSWEPAGSDAATVQIPAHTIEPASNADQPGVGDESGAGGEWQTGSPSETQIVTETMAELYLQQGHLDEAIGIYQRLVEARPEDDGLRQRMEVVQQRKAERSGRTIRSFLSVLAARRPVDLDPAVSPDDPSAGVTRGYDDGGLAPEGVFPDEHALEPGEGETSWETPYNPEPGTLESSNDQEPAEGPYSTELPVLESFTGEEDTESPYAAEPPAHESFSDEEFADELYAPEPSVGDSFRDDPLPAADPEHEDAHGGAGQAVAAGGDTIDSAAAGGAAPIAGDALVADAPDGGVGTLDRLFAGAEVSAEDEAAADMLALMFASVEHSDAPPAVSPMTGRPARPADTELSLDQVFRPGSGGERRSGTFSFDQFFSGDAEPPQQRSRASDMLQQPAAGEDDVEQFNAWLKDLKQR
jgi:tetratricopeptide (TPR) repeat protein